MERFETRAVNVFGFFVWIFFTGGFLFVLYGWSLYLTGASPEEISIKHLFGPTLLTGLPFAFYSIMLFPKVLVDKDGVQLRMPFFASQFFALDETRFQAGGLILKLGTRIGHWYVPLKRRECADALQKIRGTVQVGAPKAKVPTQVSSRFYVVSVTFPMAMLFLNRIESILENVGYGLSPWIRAPIWGATMFLFTTMFFHEAPFEMKIWKLDKIGSAILLGAGAGIPTFLTLLFR